MRLLIGPNRPEKFVSLQTLVSNAYLRNAQAGFCTEPTTAKLRGTSARLFVLTLLVAVVMPVRARAMGDEVPTERAENAAANPAAANPAAAPADSAAPATNPDSAAEASGTVDASRKTTPNAEADWKPASTAESDANADQQPTSAFGIPTLGGRQFWGDVRFFQGWTIQKNVLTGHYRLLDPRDRRHSSGTLQDCEQQLQQVREQLNLQPMTGTAVLLLHGIGRSSHSFSGMTKALRQNKVLVVPFDYPSTRLTIQQSAEYLHDVIQSLQGIQRIDVVAHSMGGLLLRAYLMKYQEPRFGSAVMLGVPNRGAEIADVLQNNPLFKAILGPAGQQLVTSADCLVQSLPAPAFPFGVIAGGRSQPKGFNPMLPGDNDLTVTVASTRLPGAADFRIVPVMHSFLMNDQAVIGFTRNFLQHGCFDSAKTAQPIAADAIEVLE